MMHETNEPDPVYDSDRNGGVTPPETGAESSDVVGRPAGSDERAAGFRESTETLDRDRSAFSGEEALKDGGSFDGLGIPAADD
jgi:hypothetical protein